MTVQLKHTRTEYGVRVGVTVLAARNRQDAQTLLRTLTSPGSTVSAEMVTRRVKTVEHRWETAS